MSFSQLSLTANLLTPITRNKFEPSSAVSKGEQAAIDFPQITVLERHMTQNSPEHRPTSRDYRLLKQKLISFDDVENARIPKSISK